MTHTDTITVKITYTGHGPPTAGLNTTVIGRPTSHVMLLRQLSVSLILALSKIKLGFRVTRLRKVDHIAQLAGPYPLGHVDLEPFQLEP